MSDWLDATDPVPARREERRFPLNGVAEEYQRGEEHRSRIAAAIRRSRRPQRASEPSPWVLDPDFEEMGA